ncbi:MAG: spermidine synthase [Planctomycetota bacterium]
MNVAVLVLLPAALLGLGVMLAGQGLSALAPGGGVWILLGMVLGAAFADARGLARRASLAGMARWLGAAAICAALLARAAPGLVSDGWTVSFEGAVPLVWAFLVGGALPWCVGVCVRAGWQTARAGATVVLFAALGAAAGAPLALARLGGTTGPFLAAALALAVAALCSFLCASSQPAPPSVPVADRDARDRSAPLLLAGFLGGALIVPGWMGSLRGLVAVHGDSLSLRAEVALAIPLGAAIAALALALGRRVTSAGVQSAVALILGVLALEVAPRLVAPGATDPRIEQVLWSIAPLGLFGAMLLIGAGGASVIGWPAGSAFGRVLMAMLAGGAAGVHFVPGLFGGDPGWGTSGVFRAASTAAALGAVFVVLSSRPLRAATNERVALRWSCALLGVAALVASRMAAPIELPWQTRPDETALLRRVEGAEHVVSLVQTQAQGARLVVDGRSELFGPAEAALGRRMGRLAAAMHPAASRALLVGRGAGHVLAGLSMTSAARVDCIEPVEELLALDLEVPFPPGIEGLGGPPHVVHAAPREWFGRRPHGYDLVVGGLSHPGARGAGARLSREHFVSLRAALAEDGVAVQWLPLHRMGWPAFVTVANAFLDAFPDARLFVASLRSDLPLVALVGGLDDGLPEFQRVDALLAASPAIDGLAAAVDIADLYVADGWTLMTRFRDEPMNTQERPLAELLCQDTRGDELWLAAGNMRRLAHVSLPLDTSSLRGRPVDPKQDRRLGAELTARSAALTGLLIARAARSELLGAAPGALSDDERSNLSEELDAALLASWGAAPGHRDVRDALLEHASELTFAERYGAAAELLGAAHEVLPDGRLGGALGGVLLRLRLLDQALEILADARSRAPDDRTVLVNLGTALIMLGRDAEALDAWVAARAAFAPARLPPLQYTALALLEAGEDLPAARAAAAALRGAMPADDPWAGVLERLLGEARVGAAGGG